MTSKGPPSASTERSAHASPCSKRMTPGRLAAGRSATALAVISPSTWKVYGTRSPARRRSAVRMKACEKSMAAGAIAKAEACSQTVGMSRWIRSV